jgi:hypothetical protein
MRTLLLVLLTVISTVLVRGAETPTENMIQFSAYYQWLNSDELPNESFYGSGNHKLLLYVVFKNAGDETVTIPTSFKAFGSGSGKSRDGKQTLGISGGIVKSSTATGDWNVPSLIELVPVELRKGEATQVKILAKVVESRPDVEQITVSYSVDKRIADRFGLWSGRLKATALPIENWTVPRQSP